MPSAPPLAANPGFVLRCATLALLGSGLPLWSQTVEWIYHKTADGLHPDGNEQQLLWLMNRARANPTAEGIFLASGTEPAIERGLQFFGVDRQLLRSEFAAIAPRPPAAFDRRIYEGSRVHSLDLIARDAQDHNNQFARIAAAGFVVQGGNARGSAFSYAETAMEAHGALNADWAYPSFPNDTDGVLSSRGHRTAIMSAQAGFLSNAGFAMVPELKPNTEVGELVFSGIYAAAEPTAANHYNRFLTGTVWADANRNNRYDPGEGINNVRVQPDRGTFHAITGAGGGWAIPVIPQSYQLTFSGNSLSSPFLRTATVATESVLVDFKITASTMPMALIVKQETGGALLLTWSGGAPPYQVQQSTNPALPWTNLGTATAATSLRITPEGPRRFYRVTGNP